MMKNKKWVEWIWDMWCVVSLAGIWPRFIEPRLLSITKLSLPIPALPRALHGLKILQFSDLHWNAAFSPYLLQKLIKKVNRLHPDLIVFTGDFLTRAKLENPEGLKHLLCHLKAKSGHFAILGNHDYAQFVTMSPEGNYDVDQASSASTIEKGFKRLFSTVHLSRKVTSRARQVEMHAGLLQLLEGTPFELLHNSSKRVAIGEGFINICGLGEYTLGRQNLEKAFENYDRDYPGVILAHNPDSIPSLDAYPGELILSGHTHGGQVNLPWMWKKFTYMEYPEFKRGLKRRGKKWAYINRGLGSTIPFRWGAVPELTLITLRCEDDALL